MNIQHPKAGLTLVELLVSFLAAAVLALVMGTMLWYSSLSYKRTSLAVNLQRDMRVSMETLAHMTRDATNFSFSTGLVYTARYDGHAPATVYLTASNLYYDPNTSVANNTLLLTSGTVARFNVTVTTNTATVVLALQQDETVISNRVVLSRRN